MRGNGIINGDDRPTIQAQRQARQGKSPGRSGTINGLWCRWLRKSAISGSAGVEVPLGGAI